MPCVDRNHITKYAWSPRKTHTRHWPIHTRRIRTCAVSVHQWHHHHLLVFQSQIGFADVFVVQILMLLVSGMLPIPTDIIQAYPKLLRVKAAVEEHPVLAAARPVVN